jgi:outer membrane protein insertion porin family
MNKFYRINGSVVPHSRAVAVETAQVHGKGSACMTFSGIAAAVSLGIPFSQIAQAAPSASYMVPENRGAVLLRGLAGNASFAAENGIASRRVGAPILAIDASSSGDFWRIAGARVGPSEERTVVSSGQKKRKKHPLNAAKKTAVVAGAGVAVAPRKSAAVLRAKQRAMARHDESASSEAANGGDSRYDSTHGAMSAPFYDVVRRPDTSWIIDDRGTGAGSRAASWMAGRPQQYLSAAFTGPDSRTDGVMADQVGVSDGYTLAAAPVYSKPWASSANGDSVRIRTSARSIQPMDLYVVPEAAADTAPPDSALHAGGGSAGAGSAGPSTLADSAAAGKDAAGAEHTLLQAAPLAITEDEEATTATAGGGEGASTLASNEAGNTVSEHAPISGASRADIDTAQVSQDVSTDSRRVGSGTLVVGPVEAGANASPPISPTVGVAVRPTLTAVSEIADPTTRPANSKTASPTVGPASSVAATSTISPAATQSTTPALGESAKQDLAQTIAPSPAKDPTETGSNTPVNDGAKIRQITFTGNNLFSAKVLQEEMQMFPTGWNSWYTQNDVYSKHRLAEGLKKVRQYYLDRGYLEYRAESVETSAAPDGKGVSLAIAVHEGERYTLSAVRVAGGPPDLETELAGLNKLQAGQVLSVGKLLGSTNAIVERLGRDGYPYATVSPMSQVDPDRHTVDLTLQVDPGRRVSVRRVEVTGNTITRDEVVRREVRQSEQDWYDPKKVAASRDRLNGLGFFSAVDVTTVPVPGSPDQVDVNVNVVENPGATVKLGVGYSTTDRAIGSAEIVNNNVFGSGQSIGASFSIAKPFRTFDITQADPYFTSGGVSRTTSAYYRANVPLYYSSDSRFTVVTQGVNTRFGIPLSDSDQIYAGVALEHNRLDPDALTPQNYIEYINRYGRQSTNVPVTVGWTRDTRESGAQSSSGYVVRIGVEYGTPAGSNQYYKADVNARYYQAFTRDVVLAMSLQGGYGGGVGNNPYPIYENYFAGGIGSVRGYEPNSLSPRDIRTGQPIGGTRMLAGSLELKVPVPFMGGNKGLNAFTFLDGGNAWGAQGASIGSNGMRFSYGMGFAWNSPVGTFKLSVGFPIVRHEFDQYQKVQFQFETVF